MNETDKEVIVPVPPPFQDERGAIHNLVEAPFGSVLLISSKAGAIRANHFHKTDYHYCWLQSGRMIYYQRPVGSKDEPEAVTIEAGQVFYTPPMHEHAMRFTEDSVFLCFARNSRQSADYEGDTVRVSLVS
jgi:dTDP-4-dehydrorhamnose 3,5-epimerase-like enzyme